MEQAGDQKHAQSEQAKRLRSKSSTPSAPPPVSEAHRPAAYAGVLHDKKSEKPSDEEAPDVAESGRL